MSSDTPPSIPPRKPGGSDASEKPAGGRTATDTGSRAPATAAQPKTGAAARGSAVKPKPSTTPASGGTSSSSASTSTTPRPAPGGTPTSGAAASAPAAGASTTTTETVRPASSGTGASSARPAAATGTSSLAGSGPRRVRLAISRVDPWSVMKLSFLMSVAIGIMIVVATAVVWFALDSLQVFATIEGLVVEILADSDFDLMQYVQFDRVISVSTLVAVVDIVLITALATIGAFLYNITAALVGGIHVTMTDE